jgi:hypothetical protein
VIDVQGVIDKYFHMSYISLKGDPVKTAEVVSINVMRKVK